jgi:GNAT superfamily N-acetyltransferase
LGEVEIRYLADEPGVLPTLRRWFESEWPGYYGHGEGDVVKDLAAYASKGSVPLGLVAFQAGKPCGFVALKRESFPTHPHLSPWAGAAYVEPRLRRQGIGAALLLALEPEARVLGLQRIYCATSTSVSLLQRCHWQLLESVNHEGHQVSIYEKALERR